MQLYDLSYSPYSSRVRIAIRARKLSIKIVAPPFALHTDEFKAKSPLGKIPLLELDDGNLLPESWVILEYLEDRFDQLPLRPSDPLDRAQMRLLGRFADLYLGPAIFPLFGELRTPSNDIEKITRHLANMQAELGKLDRLLNEMPTLGDRAFHLGDVALVTTMYFVDAIGPLFGHRDPIMPYAAVTRWWTAVRVEPAVAQTLAEIDLGFRGFLKTIGKE